MFLLLWETVWLLDALIFGGLVFLVMTTPRRRGGYDVYEGGTNIIVIHEPTGETIRLRTIVDRSPKVLLQFHYAEELPKVGWFKSDVYAEIELSDCETESLGKARTKNVYRGDTHPTWLSGRGLVTIVLPAHQLELSRITVKVELKAANALKKDTLIASGTVGTLDTFVHGNPVETKLTPTGTVVLAAVLRNVNEPPIAPVHIKRTTGAAGQTDAPELAVAVAEPITQPTLPPTS